MLSILLLEIYQRVGKQKGNFRCLGNVKREEYNKIRVPKVYSNVPRWFSICYMGFLCNHSFILLTVVMVYLNFTTVTVQIRHTPNYPWAKDFTLSYFVIILIDSGAIKTVQSKCNLVPHLGVFFEFDFWTFTLPSNLSTIPQLNFKNVSEIHQYCILKIFNLWGYITNGPFFFHLQNGEILVMPDPLQTASTFLLPVLLPVRYVDICLNTLPH